MRKLALRPLSDSYAVCRLDPMTPDPAWTNGGEFVAVVRTAGEMSIVCPDDCVPADTKHERGWRCFRLEGEFAFDEVGILVSVLEPLAKSGIGVFAVSTFGTDYVMVKIESEFVARSAWIQAGHAIIE
jgi:hypothetical protein